MTASRSAGARDLRAGNVMEFDRPMGSTPAEAAAIADLQARLATLAAASSTP